MPNYSLLFDGYRLHLLDDGLLVKSWDAVSGNAGFQSPNYLGARYLRASGHLALVKFKQLRSYGDTLLNPPMTCEVVARDAACPSHRSSQVISAIHKAWDCGDTSISLHRGSD